MRQNSNAPSKLLQDNLFGNVTAKHRKTIDDIHQQTVVSVKFVGDLSNSKDFHVLTSDLQGVVYFLTFSDGVLVFSVFKQCIMRQRLGASYSLAPLLNKGLSLSNQAYMNAMKSVDQNIYRTL